MTTGRSKVFRIPDRCVDPTCGKRVRLAGSEDDGRPTYGARGLCAPCYHRHAREETLDDFPRKTRSTEMTMYELYHLGFDPRLPCKPQFRRFGKIMDTDPRTLEKAYHRHLRQTAPK